MARVKKSGNKNKNDSSSSSSQSPKRSPSPQVAPLSKDKSGTKSSSSTSFKSLPDHENEIEVQSNPSTQNTSINPPNISRSNQPTVETALAQQSPPPTTVQISEVLIGAIPITCKTVTTGIEPIQCSQTIAETTNEVPQKKPILPGRVYNFDDLVNTNHDLTQFTNPLGWTSLFNIRETHYPNLISAFYFNAVIPSDRNSIVSELKKAKIKITEELLGKLLDIPTTGHKLYGESWFSMARVSKNTLMSEIYEPGTNLTKNPPSSKLKHVFKMLHNMCLHSIFPRKGSKDKVTENDMMIMYHMFNKIQLNLPYVMIQHMIYTIENESKRFTLPYGMFLTRVFNKFKVSFEGEEGKNSSTTFSLKNVGRMKFIGDVEDHTILDQGQKRKREEFEKDNNLDLLAEVMTTQEDHPETVLPVSAPSEKAKEVVSEKTTSAQFNPFVSLEFDNLRNDFENHENQHTTVLNDGFSTINNPVNTSIFSPLMTSPQTSFDTTDFLKNFLSTPSDCSKIHQPIYTDVGPSLPSFPQNFASMSSFCTSYPTNDSAAYQSSANIPPFDTRPTKKSKVEQDVSKTIRDMVKMFEAVKINNTLLNYAVHEHQLFRTWLIDEFCPAMRVNPPPSNPPPQVPEFPELDKESNSDPSSPADPQ
ncbi:hypothetical protein L195_g026101 [Trifolium pratense]|uniref:Putative plant transposon protein domain-containing protein n=1 Tax=Trifolium pratense TaxID=57577 RepID=A0A2K3NIC7_TRIPR|nr:hypothetical protein L195_g026101 [Trifolium pratense]